MLFLLFLSIFPPSKCSFGLGHTLAELWSHIWEGSSQSSHLDNFRSKSSSVTRETTWPSPPALLPLILLIRIFFFPVVMVLLSDDVLMNFTLHIPHLSELRTPVSYGITLNKYIVQTPRMRGVSSLSSCILPTSLQYSLPTLFFILHMTFLSEAITHLEIRSHLPCLLYRACGPYHPVSAVTCVPSLLMYLNINVNKIENW